MAKNILVCYLGEMCHQDGVDYRDQDFRIRIDFHKKNWFVRLRTNQMELRTFSRNPSLRRSYQHMDHNYPGGWYNQCLLDWFLCFLYSSILKQGAKLNEWINFYESKNHECCGRASQFHEDRAAYGRV